MQEGSLFSTPLAFIGCGFFDDGHSGQYEVISHCSFDLHFSNNQWYWASFHVFISHLYVFFVASLVVQMVKNSLAMQEIWVQSLGWEGPWRREWHSTPVFLPGESPWTEEPGGLQSMESQRVGHDWATCTHISSLEKYLFRSFAHFLIVLFVFLVLSCMSLQAFLTSCFTCYSVRQAQEFLSVSSFCWPYGAWFQDGFFNLWGTDSAIVNNASKSLGV